MLGKVYLVTGVVILGLYVWYSFSGWEIEAPRRAGAPADVRRAPGGYRPYQTGHSGYSGGYHGGK